MTQANSQQPQSNRVDATLSRHGGLSYLEIPAIDARRSAAFYASVLGWKMEGADTDHPKFSDLTGHLIGRWVTSGGVSKEPGFLPYFYVDRIEDVVKRVVSNGGEIVKPVYREGNLWVSTIRDPAGNVLGLWQEAGE